MSDDLSKYLTDSKFIKFINAFKNYYWTKDLYDIHFLIKNFSEIFNENLKLNDITRNILELYYKSFEDSISTELKAKNLKKHLSITESLVFLSQKHDRMINDFGKDSIEASQILNEYLDYRLKLRVDLEKDFEDINNEDIEKHINDYQNSLWSFFNKTRIIYLEHENEVLIIWKENDQQSIFIKSEEPKKEEIN
jgi:hypothetical protein